MAAPIVTGFRRISPEGSAYETGFPPTYAYMFSARHGLPIQPAIQLNTTRYKIAILKKIGPLDTANLIGSYANPKMITPAR
jgi:hypothetical protein